MRSCGSKYTCCKVDTFQVTAHHIKSQKSIYTLGQILLQNIGKSGCPLTERQIMPDEPSIPASLPGPTINRDPYSYLYDVGFLPHATLRCSTAGFGAYLYTRSHAHQAGQFLTHAVHRMHSSLSVSTESPTTIAPVGQTAEHTPHRLHSASVVAGDMSELQ